MILTAPLRSKFEPAGKSMPPLAAPRREQANERTFFVNRLWDENFDFSLMQNLGPIEQQSTLYVRIVRGSENPMLV